MEALSLVIVGTKVTARQRSDRMDLLSLGQNKNSWLPCFVNIYSEMVFKIKLSINIFYQRCRGWKEFRIHIQLHLLSYPILHLSSLRIDHDAPISQGYLEMSCLSILRRMTSRSLGLWRNLKTIEVNSTDISGCETTTTILLPRGRGRRSTDDPLQGWPGGQHGNWSNGLAPWMKSIPVYKAIL